MNINIGPINTHHHIPDISHVFERELKNILIKLRYHKGDQFDGLLDPPFAKIYYALGMCIEYQEKSDGTIPSNIVDTIWDYVSKIDLDIANPNVQLNADSQQELKEAQESFDAELKKIFFTKIQEPHIIRETKDYWEMYKL